MTYEAGIAEGREERDLFLREHYASPLPEEDQAGFEGLDYYPVDPVWRVRGTFTRHEPQKVQIPSTSGMDSPYTTVGVFDVGIGESTYQLVVLDDGDGGVFVPFRDGTSGTETYAGGRYVTVEAADTESAVLDFNAAHNPWCVYDEEFVCPLPPASNWITEPIPAGEKMYQRSQLR